MGNSEGYIPIEKKSIDKNIEEFNADLSKIDDISNNLKNEFTTVYRVLLIVIALLQKLKLSSKKLKSHGKKSPNQSIKNATKNADTRFEPMTRSQLENYIKIISKIPEYYKNSIISKFGNSSKFIQKPDGFQSIHFISSKNKTVVKAKWASLSDDQTKSSIESKSDRFTEFNPSHLGLQGNVDTNEKLYLELTSKEKEEYLDIIDILADVYNVIIRHLMFIDYSYRQYIKVPIDLKPDGFSAITNGMSQISSQISSYNLIFLQLIRSLLESGISKKRREEEELKQKAELDRLLRELDDQFKELIAAFELEKKKFLERYNSVNDESLKKEIIAQNAEIKSVVELCNSNKYKDKQITLKSKEALFSEIKQDTAAIIKGLTAFNNAYINILEDQKGAVRVYVKVKYDNGDLGGITISKYGGNAKNSNTNVRKRDQNVMSQVDQNSDNYKLAVGQKTFITNNVFNGFINLDIARKAVGMDAINKAIDEENRIVYEQQCKGLFKQVLDGYSIVFFGYGFSGSGKTTILLGNGNNRGIVQYGFMDDEFINNVEQIQVANIFELYVDNYKYNTQLLSQCKGKIIDHSTRDIIYKAGDDKNNISINIQLILNRLKSDREKEKRIIKTTNNPESSRSHLFIVFEVITKLDKKGYVTVCDLGGSEDPFIIMRQTAQEIFNIQKGVEQLSFQALAGYDKKKIESNNITLIMNQGVYINESLNHMKYFFKTQSNPKVCSTLKTDEIMNSGKPLTALPNVYNSDKFIHSPYNECMQPASTNLDNIKGNVKMYSVLNYLKNLGNGKMTKFVMFCAIRTKQAASDATLKTLQFAEQVSSKARSK